MSLSKLDEMCRGCPFADQCENKRMEAVGCLRYPLAAATAESAAAPVAEPAARETVTICVNGEVQTVYRDEIERQLYRHLYAGLGLQYGG